MFLEAKVVVYCPRRRCAVVGTEFDWVAECDCGPAPTDDVWRFDDVAQYHWLTSCVMTSHVILVFSRKLYLTLEDIEIEDTEWRP